ncbi:MAG: archease [Anaerolineae bacterium]
MEEGFEEIEHTADVALHIWGRDLAELFVNAARGMASLMVEPETVEPAVEISLELTADDAEALLVTWLGELLYLSERDDIVFIDFDVQEITHTRLRGKARGGPTEGARGYIKAVTFSELEIHPTERGLETNVVFDV